MGRYARVRSGLQPELEPDGRELHARLSSARREALARGAGTAPRPGRRTPLMEAAATLAPATRDAVRQLLRHREQGAALLAGCGLEIGALHYPLALPRGCTVDHLDVEDADTLRARFPELADEQLVVPRYRGDVVRDTVPAI